MLIVFHIFSSVYIPRNMKDTIPERDGYIKMAKKIFENGDKASSQVPMTECATCAAVSNKNRIMAGVCIQCLKE